MGSRFLFLRGVGGSFLLLRGVCNGRLARLLGLLGLSLLRIVHFFLLGLLLSSLLFISLGDLSGSTLSSSIVRLIVIIFRALHHFLLLLILRLLGLDLR